MILISYLNSCLNNLNSWIKISKIFQVYNISMQTSGNYLIPQPTALYVHMFIIQYTQNVQRVWADS